MDPDSATIGAFRTVAFAGPRTGETMHASVTDGVMTVDLVSGKLTNSDTGRSVDVSGQFQVPLKE